MSNAKSRFRRGRGDNGDPGEIEPAFQRPPPSTTIETQASAAALSPTAPIDSDTPIELPATTAEAPASNQLLIDDSLFPPFERQLTSPAAGDNTLTNINNHDTNTDHESGGFGGIPQREVQAEPDPDGSRAKERENRKNKEKEQAEKNRLQKEKDRQRQQASISRGMFSCFGNSSQAQNKDSNNGKPNQNQQQNNEANNNDNVAPKSSNDLPRYYQRIEYLKSVQQNSLIYPFYKCSRMLWMGYDNEEFQRVIPFAKAYPSFDLANYTQGWTLGVILQTIDTFRQNIIGLVRPIVKVHVLDIATGMYVKSVDSPPARPVFTSATPATDSGSSAKWNEEVQFDADYADIVSEKSVILFEIIDERPHLSTGRSTYRNKRVHQYKKIAWGYLLPIGTDGRLNVGLADRKETNGEISATQPISEANVQSNSSEEYVSEHSRVPKLALPSTTNAKADMFDSMKSKDINMRIQLYQYREYDGIIGFIQRSVLTWPGLNVEYTGPAEANYPSKVPPIYLQWRMLRKTQLDGAFLRISIGSRVRKIRKIENTHRTMESEPEAGPTTARSKKDIKSASKSKKKRRKARSKEERTKLRAAAMRRSRGLKDACVIPDKFLNRVEVGPDGAMNVAFSNSGHLLAIASRMFAYHGSGSSQEIIYSLRLYDTDLDEEIWVEEVAHHAIIYDLKWSKNDRFLISCSGDGTCKIWDFLAFSPVLSQYSNAYYAHQAAINRNKAAGGGDDDTLIGTQLHTARTANTYNTAGNHTGFDNHTHDDMSPTYIAKMYPPQVTQVLPLSAQVVAYCAVFQEFSNAPFVLPPPAMQFKDDALTNGEFNYYIEQLNVLKSSYAPRVIIGCSDGRIRVFDSGRLMGYVMVVDKDETGKQKDFSPHDGVVNSLVIDERSKYLISADSFGDILAWRLDGKGWYQLLRKFKRDVGLNDPALVEHFDNGSVLSLSMHPEKLKGLMLVLSRQPSVLRVVNMSTYKPLSYCEGFTGISANVVRENDDSFSTGVFHRAQFTADGKYIVCCVQDTQNKQQFRLMFWETFTGHLVPSPLSKLSFPYPIRNIAWHPTQHLVAVAMAGPGAAVNLYSADQESPSESPNFGATQVGMLTTGNIGETDPFRRSTNSLGRSITSLDGQNDVPFGRSPDKKFALPTIAEGQSTKSSVGADSEAKDDRAEKAKAILAKVRAAKASKQN